MDLGRAQSGRGIGGEEGRAAAAGEEDNLARLKVLDGAAGIVALAHAHDVHGGHDARLRAELTQHIAHGDAVHTGGEHAHAVGVDALDLSGSVLDAAPEVAAADDDADLGALLGGLFQHLAHGGDEVKVKAGLLLPGQRLTADLDNDTVELFHGTNPFGLSVAYGK